MNKLFFIVGETGSGKDTVVRKLTKSSDLVVSYTTRPIRGHEVNGREHWFVSNDEMDRIEKEETLIAWTKTGEFRYCATVEKLNGASVYIINPDGIRWFKQYGPKDIEIITIGIYVPLDERRKRCKYRSDYSTNFDKRVADEQLDFANFRLNGEFDYLINNKDSHKTAEIIKHIMQMELNS